MGLCSNFLPLLAAGFELPTDGSNLRHLYANKLVALTVLTRSSFKNQAAVLPVRVWQTASARF